MTAAWKQGWWSALQPLERELWRGVEAQHVVATMRLVDDLAEQEVLEQLLDASKPSAPPGRESLHYLLVTPFRYRSPSPSRFRRAGEAGIWYGAEELPTACTELAYWRWRFLMDSEGLANSELVTELTFFQARVSGAAIDLCSPPWNAKRRVWTHPENYTPCQDLAQACRERGDVLWIRYDSARKVEGHCGAVLDPAGLKLTARAQQTWVYKVTRQAVLMAHEGDRLSLGEADLRSKET